ncbi:MAG: hypothetical protein ABSD98_08615 [Candidatus Korobacteraceae bacterium]|jgi:hypothetical protein
MRRAVAIVFAFLLTAAAFAQTPAPATPPTAVPSPVPAGWPTAQFASAKDPGVQKAVQILNQMIRALGGDAWLNVSNMTSEGRTYGFYHGQPNSMSILFWRFWEWPDKERVEFTKQRDVIELLIGDKGYEITYKGTATQEPKELVESLRRREHSLEWVVRKWLPAPGTMVLYSGTAMVERNLADQITLLNAGNDSVTLSVDGQTHLPVKISYSWRDPLDRQFDTASVVFSNYKLIQGIQTPFSIVQYRNDEMSAQRFITSASYNTSLSPTLFETKGITYNPGTQKPPK